MQTATSYRMRSGKTVMGGLNAVTRHHLEELAQAEPLVPRWAKWETLLAQILDMADEDSLRSKVREILGDPVMSRLIRDKSWLLLPEWLDDGTELNPVLVGPHDNAAEIMRYNLRVLRNRANQLMGDGAVVRSIVLIFTDGTVND